MKQRLISLMLALAMLFTLSACGGRQEEQEGLQLYFLTGGDELHGPALGSESFLGPANPGPEELVLALLRGPGDENLESPFPAGVTLQSVEWDETQPGNLRVYLSEQYSSLSDISLTLADYSIVLTLSQLEEVESVVILADGHAIRYRSHQRLRADEVLLTDERIGGTSAFS